MPFFLNTSSCGLFFAAAGAGAGARATAKSAGAPASSANADVVADAPYGALSREPILNAEAAFHHVLSLFVIAHSLALRVAVAPTALFLILELSTPLVNLHHFLRMRARGAARGFLGAAPGAAAPAWLAPLNGACVWLAFLVLRIGAAHALAFQLLRAAWRGAVPPASAAPQAAVYVLMLALFELWFVKITRSLITHLRGHGKAD
jgi:hypothetical protein